MCYIGKQQAKRIILIYAMGVLSIFIVLNTSFSIPCIFKKITSVPCPGCGLSRSFVLMSQLKLIEAIKMNISFLPLIIGMAVCFVCALIDMFSNKFAIMRFNSIMNRKRFIVIVAILTALSWYYNIVRDSVHQLSFENFCFKQEIILA